MKKSKAKNQPWRQLYELAEEVRNLAPWHSRFHSVGKKVIKNALNLGSVSIISGTYYFD